MILQSIFRAIAQIGDPRFRRVLLLGVGLTLALLVASYVLVFWLLGWLIGDSVTLPFIGAVGWVDDLASWSSLILMMILSIFLMIPVASAMTSIFLDDVAQAVEDRHYPDLPPASPVPLSDALRDSVGFLGVLIVANLLALILYLILPPFAPLIFWALNGFLLGREYFQLVAIRRIGRAGAKTLRRQFGLRIWIAGTLMAIPLTVPLLNLIVPILGAAAFTHLYHSSQASTSARTSRDPAR